MSRYVVSERASVSFQARAKLRADANFHTMQGWGALEIKGYGRAEERA